VVPSGLPVLGFTDCWPTTAFRFRSRRDDGLGIPLAFALLLTLPCILFRYLPMVDLPQHEAVVSMILHLGDHGWAFDSYYEWVPSRTLYLLPYLLAAALAHVIPLHRAINCIAFCSVIAYPIGVFLYLRALGRPAWVGLLSLPVVYNQSFFWGFVNFNFAVGLALVTIALTVGNWTRRRAMIVSLMAIVIAMTHIYGLLLLGAYVGFWLLSGERRQAAQRLPALIPVALGLSLWAILIRGAGGARGMVWPAFAHRWSQFADSIAGGWRGYSERAGLLFALVVAVVFFRNSIPFTVARWKSLKVHERIAWQLVAVNLLLYFSMPELRVAAMKASFRHAQLAAMALPLALATETTRGASHWARPVLYLLGAYIVVSSWLHLRRFDVEARSFDAIAAAVPHGSRLAQLTYERQGSVAKVPAYLHFAAYAQANKGGLLAVSFPARFWNIPIGSKTVAGVPHVPNDLEWKPALFGESQLSQYFDCVIIRSQRNREPPLPEPFPYLLQLKSGPWRLLRKCEPIHD